MRYLMRGIDADGQVANFAETEQIVSASLCFSSFVQIRGSIPLFWTQLPNFSLKPKPRLTPTADHEHAARIHFRELRGVYGPQVLVNLIDNKGGEKTLADRFRELVNNLQDQALRCGMCMGAIAWVLI
jgi:phosphatidylinositol 4-phosphatase